LRGGHGGHLISIDSLDSRPRMALIT
jgi:hypothetical protein